MEADKKLVVVFKSMAVKDDGASAKAGRPIYKDQEVCEIRAPGDRLMVKVFPAHAFAGWRIGEHGDQEEHGRGQHDRGPVGVGHQAEHGPSSLRGAAAPGWV